LAGFWLEGFAVVGNGNDVDDRPLLIAPAT
jgi:hypothetical protein